GACVQDLPNSCIDAHFALGEICPENNARPLEVVWTWVNGSDILLGEAKSLAQSQFGPKDPYRPLRSDAQARLYRDHDELRFSMRSVLANFRQYAGRFHLITADFPMPQWLAERSNISDPKSWRLGQMPQWLDTNNRLAHNMWQDGNTQLSITHHAQIFRPYTGTNFNSLAIESQLGHMENVSDYLIDLHTMQNDDLFMINPLSPISFYTPAYGVVLHMQPDLLVNPDRLRGNNQGEWRSLGESNFLLSKRFGRRYRPYVAHEAKVASRALLHEMATWPQSFAASAAHPFRETADGDGDVNAFFMHAHFIVERAREALLWSWVVGRVGALNGTWGEAEARRAWEEIGGAWGESDLLVETSHRDTLTRERVERVLLQISAAELDLVFILYVSSLDGYAYAGLGAYGRPEWVSFAPEINEGHLPRCRISYEKCFAMEHPESEGQQRRASEIFTDIAFRNEACGDCVVLALTKASGSHGLSAFLPASDRVLPPVDNEDGEREVPHLPLVANWEDGDFSLFAVMGMKRELNVRQWVLQLLQRYRYVIGDTPSLFERVSSPQGAVQVVAHIERTPHVALLCINDDAMKESLTSQVKQVLKIWFNRCWKKPATWEQR
ncbi:uncharacterized protein LAESUDRAFT_732875, partial [Laetiporus sulphureus 93-53]